MSSASGFSYLRPCLERVDVVYSAERYMHLFFEISLIFALATVVAFVMQWLRLPLLLGHIITGVLAGPAVFQLIQGKETIEVFSQLGITALLFVVGLSLNPAVIREVGKIALFTGIGQIAFTTLFGVAIAVLLGYPLMTSLFLAVALTFSSTIIIMKLLSDRGDEGTLYGKISMGFLLVQDLVATVILILASSLTSADTISIALLETAGKSLVLAALLSGIARYILPRVTPFFAQSQEFLFLASVGWGMGIAALFHEFGLSREIGALAAGLVLATSPYRYEITAKMRLVRDFFIIMFFVLLGSQLTWTDIGSQLTHTLIFSVFILIGNPLIVMAIMGWMRYSKKTAFFAGLTVAQISEFSLILILLVSQKGYVPSSIVSLVTLVGIITITASTIMILKADRLFEVLGPWLSIFERKRVEKERIKKESYDAIVFGCHRVGMEFLSSLKKKKLTYLVVDFDPVIIDRLKEKGIPCRYGDVSDNEYLDELNIASCKIVISTIPSIEINTLLLQKLKKAHSKALAIVSAQSATEARRLYDGGAAYVILPHFLGGNHTAMLLERHGLKQAKFAAERKQHLYYLDGRASDGLSS